MKPAEIRLLPECLANQIAAGEVVERPASVVKELVENSLDAGATRIDVRLDNGGQSLIRVQDNGIGIDAAQLELAVTRHATSKIGSSDDLASISTYGFRGEALPSIASVSQFRLVSRGRAACARNEPASWIEISHGKLSGTGAANLPCGTIVEARDLFGNLPARLRFLKSPASELKHAQAWLVRLALANTAVSFTLSAGERQILHFSQNQDLTSRLRMVWPADIVDQLLPIDSTFHNIHLKGLAAPPQLRQPRPDRIFFFVNGRAVNDKRLMSAVREAYRGRQISREYPLLALFVELDPADLDINVHPAKTEVRFQNESALFSAVSGALGHAFCASPVFAGSSSIQSESVERHVPRPQGFWGSLDDPMAPVFAKNSQPSSASAALLPDTGAKPESSAADPETSSMSVNAASLNEAALTYNDSQMAMSSDEKAHESFIRMPEPLRYKWLAQIADTYLIMTDADNALILLDQHAAHERILFNRFKNGNSTDSMRLMTPIEIRIETGQNPDLAVPILNRSGFSCQIKGRNLVADEIPQILSRSEAREFLLALLSGRIENADAIFASMACKAAIKAGQALAPDEARELVRQWQDCEDSDFCPHGRPCVLRFEPYLLEKMFKRR